MSGLLKADFYRLFRSKFFDILGGVVLLLSLAVFALFALIVEFGGEIGGAMTAGALQRLSFDGTVGYCAAIAAAVFVCSDFSGGGIRDKVARGCGRGKVFFSLWIALSFAVLVYYLLTQFVVFALGGAAFGWEGGDDLPVRRGRRDLARERGDLLRAFRAPQKDLLGAARRHSAAVRHYDAAGGARRRGDIYRERGVFGVLRRVCLSDACRADLSARFRRQRLDRRGRVLRVAAFGRAGRPAALCAARPEIACPFHKKS